MALALGVSTFAQNLWSGKETWEAASVGAAVILCGLVGWALYHVVSRRNDGLACLIMAAVMVGQPDRPFRPFLTSVLIGLVTLVPINLVVGLLARRLKPEKATPGSIDPMFDAEADRTVVESGTPV